MAYLSDEWIQRADAALSDDAALREATADAELAIEYTVTGAPGGATRYALTVDHGAVHLEPGAHPDAPVTFALDYDTAVEIARGEGSAQAAFMQGRLKLGGDATVLLHQHALLEGVGDALAELRDDTQY